MGKNWLRTKKYLATSGRDLNEHLSLTRLKHFQVGQNWTHKLFYITFDNRTKNLILLLLLAGGSVAELLGLGL